MDKLASETLTSLPVMPYHSDILQILINDLVPFGISSFLALVVSFSLASVNIEGKPGLGRRLVLVHSLPLFIAPVVVCQVLIRIAETVAGEEALKSLFLLAFLGYLFHVWLGWYILDSVFNLKDRLRKVRKILASTSHSSLADLFLVSVLEFGWPAFFTFISVFLFQEAMISAPFFMDTSCSTITSYLLDKSSQHLAFEQKLALVFSVVSAIFALFLLTWGLYSSIVWIVSKGHHNWKSVKVKRGSRVLRWVVQGRFFSRLVVILSILSAAVSAVASIVVLVDLAINSFGEFEPAVFWNMLSSLLSPGVLAALLGSLLVVGSVIAFSLGSEHQRAWGNKLINSESARIYLPVFALIPPSLIAVLSLVFIVGDFTQLVIGYASLVGYSIVLVLFFFPPATLRNDLTLINNSASSAFYWKRKLLVVMSTKAFGLSRPLVLAVYFLWLEDSIQAKVLAGNVSLAANVRGLKLSPLLSSTYLGILVCFVVFASLIGVGFLIRKWRFERIERVLESA